MSKERISVIQSHLVEATKEGEGDLARERESGVSILWVFPTPRELANPPEGLSDPPSSSWATMNHSPPCPWPTLTYTTM